MTKGKRNREGDVVIAIFLAYSRESMECICIPTYYTPIIHYVARPMGGKEKDLQWLSFERSHLILSASLYFCC